MMATSISSKAKINHDINKYTKWVIEKIFSPHIKKGNKEIEYAKTKRKSGNGKRMTDV